jgi:hypothetical protein
MFGRIGTFLVAASLLASTGCLCQGICTKRQNELCCPTDVRKTHFWCFGEDSIMHCPCGPKEELYGYEPTQWREFPECSSYPGCAVGCGAPVQPLLEGPLGVPQGAVEELPRAQIAPGRSNPFGNDSPPNPKSTTPAPVLKPTPVPSPASSQLEPARLPTIGGGGSFSSEGDDHAPTWTGDLDLKSLDDSPAHAHVAKDRVPSSARRPLLESSVSEDEVIRRRSFVDQAATK